MDLDFRRDPYLESEANVYGGENIRTGQESFWDTMVPIYSFHQTPSTATSAVPLPDGKDVGVCYWACVYPICIGKKRVR